MTDRCVQPVNTFLDTATNPS